MRNKPYPLYTDIPNTNSFPEFLEAITQNGNKPAVKYKNGKEIVTKSFIEFSQDIRRISLLLKACGISHGDVVAVIGENSYEWLVHYFAITCMGAIVLPTDTGLTTEEIAGNITNTNSKLICVSDKLATLRQELLQSITVKTLSMQENLIECAKLDCAESDFSKTEPDDMAAIIFTSGTSGKPKGVMLTHRSLLADFHGSRRNCKWFGDMLSVLPMYHSFCIVTILVGLSWGKTLFVSSNIRRLSVEMTCCSPWIVCLVPVIVETIYNNIWENASKNGKTNALNSAIKLSNCLLACGIDVRKKLFKQIHMGLGGNLSVIISGGAPLDEKFVQGFRDFGIDVLNGYGITECSPVVAVNRNHHYRDGSVGLPLHNVTVKIDSPDGNGEGEILVAGDIVMKGYYNDPEATAAAFTEDGFFRTGDKGYIDKGGFLYVTGRLKNLIILSNGKNVSPEELEFEVSHIEGVCEVICYGENDIIVAEVYPNEGASEQAIRDGVKMLDRKLPSYKQINKVVFRDVPFERTSSNKIKRIRKEN